MDNVLTPQRRFTAKRITTIGLTTAALIVGAWLLVTFERPMPATKNGVPIPFVQQSSPLQGSVYHYGNRGNIEVKEIKFFADESSETLAVDKIYLVHVPAGSNIVNAPLDDVMTLVSDGSHNVDYYGYQYFDSQASLEKRNISEALFKNRFPGSFFASAKARAGDAAHGGFLARFESMNGISFLKTSTVGVTEGVVVRLEPDSLYVFVVNEDGGGRISIRSICGNGIKESGEVCDDGNALNGDSCKNDCTAGLPIPFDDSDGSHGAPPECPVLQCPPPSSAQCVPNPQALDQNGCPSSCTTYSCPTPVVDPPPASHCGDAKKEGSEACDDGNVAADDGCSATCTIESGFSCSGATGAQSSCTSTNTDNSTSSTAIQNRVKALADTDGNGTVSQNEDLSFRIQLMNIEGILAAPYEEVKKYDVSPATIDNTVTPEDILAIVDALDVFNPPE